MEWIWIVPMEIWWEWTAETQRVGKRRSFGITKYPTYAQEVERQTVDIGFRLMGAFEWTEGRRLFLDLPL
jgi:hypothetical protein